MFWLVIMTRVFSKQFIWESEYNKSGMDQFGGNGSSKKFRLSSRLRTDFRNSKKEPARSSSRNVRFSEQITNAEGTRKKHHSASILKKSRLSSMDRPKVRSDSVNSMAGQGPKDDQGCDNSNLNRVIKEQYLNLMEMYSKKGNYVDDIFPPVLSSLFSYAGRKKNKYPPLKWMRISELFPERSLIMWGADPTRNRIVASSILASQYFVQGLNCLKNSKGLMRRMFETQQPNLQGVYYVRIFQGNTWKYIIIDDNIPVVEDPRDKGAFKPAFVSVQPYSQDDPVEIWPFLVEKAFAKHYSSYEALQYGNLFDFVEQLTNKPCEYINLETQKVDIRNFFKAAEVLAFGETNQGDKSALITCSETETILFEKDSKSYQIVPQQICKYFDHLYIFGIRNYQYIGQCPIRQPKESISCRTFSLKNAMHCSLSLYQKDQRHFHENVKYQYSWIRIILVQKEFNGGYRWIDGRYDNQKSMSIEADLQVGEYVLLVMPEWGPRVYDLSLIIRSKLPVRLERKAYEQGIIEQACADMAQRYGRLNQLNTHICSYNCIYQDMGMIIENINNERTRGQIRILRSIQGLQSSQEIVALNKQFKNSKSIEVIIKSNSHFTVVLAMKGGVDRDFFRNFDFGSR